MCVSVGYKAAANLKYIHEENLPKRCYDELSRHWHPEWNSPFQVPHGRDNSSWIFTYFMNLNRNFDGKEDILI